MSQHDLTIPSLAETPPEAYRALGMRCGLEVHRQLLTAKKLCCRCPAGPYRKDWDAVLLRRLRPTLSEMGEYDRTALMEAKAKKEIVYQVTGDTTCTYEMDDSPPFTFNLEAVDIALSVAIRLDAAVVGQVHVARKQYLDGSIPAGCQRTAVVGIDGRVRVADREVGISQIAVEEDAAREISDEGHRRTYRTDRLSRPLVEVVTEPELTTPGEAEETMEALATLLRATGRVRRGLGTARQDVNVSIRGGARVEIKGVPRIRLVAKLVHFEAFRQRALLELRDDLLSRGLDPETFHPVAYPAPLSVAAIPVESLREALHDGAEARILRLPGFRGTLDRPVGPTRTFLSELSDLARVVGCLDAIPNLLAEDVPAPEVPEEFWGEARELCGAGESDALILVWGPYQDLLTAVGEISDRARAALREVPAETRQYRANGESRFERVLPVTPDRMYPETDLPPYPVTEERLTLLGWRAPPEPTSAPSFRRGAEVLSRFGAQTWSEVILETTRGPFSGTVLPRPEKTDDRYLVLKISSGHNLGVAADTILSLAVTGQRVARYHVHPREITHLEGRPRVRLIGTGGTIASRLDYRTGAAKPASSPEDLYAVVPELADVCNLETLNLYSVLSENMGPEQWIGLAREVARAIEDGVDGIVIGHGTDTMTHTAAALSFMVQDPGVPIVLVGSQRSADRPSSDAALNLLCAARTAAESDLAEVVVCMSGSASHDYCLIHPGTRVRKMHSSSRSTFRTLGDAPLGMATPDRGETFAEDHGRRHHRPPVLRAAFDDRVSLVYHVPGMRPDVIDALLERDYRGIVIAGTGLGHVNRELLPALARAREQGVVVLMTVQTLWGYAQLHVYETGRELEGLGVIAAENMLPEVAYVKLGCALAQTDDPAAAAALAMTPIAREITEREPHYGYLVFQAGLPWMKEHFRKFRM